MDNLLQKDETITFNFYSFLLNSDAHVTPDYAHALIAQLECIQLFIRWNAIVQSR